MFRFFNTTERKEFRGIVSSMTNQQLNNCLGIQKLSIKSDERNKGFLHSLAPINVLVNIDVFLILFTKSF